MLIIYSSFSAKESAIPISIKILLITKMFWGLLELGVDTTPPPGTAKLVEEGVVDEEVFVEEGGGVLEVDVDVVDVDVDVDDVEVGVGVGVGVGVVGSGV